MDQHMQSDSSNDQSHYFEESAQHINEETSSDLQNNQAVKDCYKLCFAKYINGSIHTPPKTTTTNKPGGPSIEPIELSSDADSDSQNQLKSKSSHQSSSSSSSQSASPPNQIQLPKVNEKRKRSQKKRALSKKREDERKTIKILSRIKPETTPPIQTKPTINVISRAQVTEPNKNALSTSINKAANNATPEWKQISESNRFLSRRLAKEAKINLGVHSLQQVVTFAFKEGLINKLLYYEFIMTYNQNKQSQFVNCFLGQQIEKWDFKNNKIVLSDHRRLASLLIKLKPTAYTLSNPESLDWDVSEFLKGIYDLQEDKYYRMMDYMDKISNNIWWVPLKIKYSTSSLIYESTSSLIDEFTQKNHSVDGSMAKMNDSRQNDGQNNQSQADDNIPHQRNTVIRQNMARRAGQNAVSEQQEGSDYFKSRIQKLTKPEKVIRKCQNSSMDKFKKILWNLQKNRKQKQHSKYTLHQQGDQLHSPRNKYAPKPILKQK